MHIQRQRLIHSDTVKSTGDDQDTGMQKNQDTDEEPDLGYTRIQIQIKTYIDNDSGEDPFTGLKHDVGIYKDAYIDKTKIQIKTQVQTKTQTKSQAETMTETMTKKQTQTKKQAQEVLEED